MVSTHSPTNWSEIYSKFLTVHCSDLPHLLPLQSFDFNFNVTLLQWFQLFNEREMRLEACADISHNLHKALINLQISSIPQAAQTCSIQSLVAGKVKYA